MRNILRTIFPAVLLLTFLSGSALAQTKIATVDLQKLFDNYWKTKQAQASIQDRVAQITKDDKDKTDDLKKASDEYQQLLQQANDPAISTDERDRRKKDAATKLKQLQDRKSALDQWEREAQALLTDQRQRLSDNIRADLQAAISTTAKAGGYTIVLNTAANGINIGTTAISVPSTVIYGASEVDLTAEVLKQLNAGAPIDTIPTAPPASSVPSLLMSTNGP
jgi:outer membrane protein